MISGSLNGAIELPPFDREVAVGLAHVGPAVFHRAAQDLREEVDLLAFEPLQFDALKKALSSASDQHPLIKRLAHGFDGRFRCQRFVERRLGHSARSVRVLLLGAAAPGGDRGGHRGARLGTVGANAGFLVGRYQPSRLPWGVEICSTRMVERTNSKRLSSL